ncbi:hypothetical protein ACHAWO_006696 [Cyclotella atomus]|jgi:hypothetical protein|uniref:Uncharacterized protein n=1 Tax=Cyclotella atomus TaxID=382360 RepID=A0ABD3PEG1_9STRA
MIRKRDYGLLSEEDDDDNVEIMLIVEFMNGSSKSDEAAVASINASCLE